ncbi:MAG: SurA N-terminal domain-containing protein [Verrucomicrobia bacterium]|nr:SurA N-terminal domain-containing protein [Verrucomicrobiota bacterium]
MFTTIRRHQKWLWLVIIVLVIISFTIFLDPTVSTSRGGVPTGSEEFGSINGRPITREELMATYNEVQLRFLLENNRWPDQDPNARLWFDPDQRLRERLIMLETLRDYNFKVTDKAVAQWVATVFGNGANGSSSVDAYRQLTERILPERGMTAADFQRYARNEVGIRYLLQLAAASGSLVTPREAELAYQRENEQIQVEFALFSVSNHLAEVIIDPDEVARYYTNNMARYRVPERVEVSYVAYDITNYLAEADLKLSQLTNLTEQIESFYQQRGPETFLDPNDGKIMTPEAAKAQIKDQLRQRSATDAARRVAMTFAEELYSLYEQRPNEQDHLERLAAAKGLPAAVTEPFAQFEMPPGLEVGRDFVQAAFALSPTQPMATEPLAGPNQVFIIALKRRIPSGPPEWSAVEQRVTADYRRARALEAAHRAGQEFYDRLAAGGQPLQELTGQPHITWVKPRPFSPGTTSIPELEGQVNFAQLKDTAVRLAAGKHSNLVTNNTGGFVLEVTSRQPVDEAKMKEELPAFLDRLRQEREREAINEWFRKQSENTLLAGIPTIGNSR